MDRSFAKIKKVGDKFCVFSKDGKKNLGCSDTREGAEKRLKQVEYFKNKGSLMNYQDAFSNMARAMNDDITQLGQKQDSKPKTIEVQSETLSVSDGLRNGSIAGRASERLIDNKDHFPVITETQAKSSMARVMQLNEVPAWYNGSLMSLRQEVYEGVIATHPEISDLQVRVPAEQAVALSDGQEPAATSKNDVKDPNKEGKMNRDEVPEVHRPTLAQSFAKISANIDDRKSFAGRLLENLAKQEEHLKKAKDLANRLMKSGISGKEFDALSTYVQEDILYDLMSKNITATKSVEARRRELLERMSSDAQTNPYKGPVKPTDGDDKKKKKKDKK